MQAGRATSSYNVSAPQLVSATFGTTTRLSGASESILLAADGSSKTLTIAGKDFGTSGKPAVWLGETVVPAASVTRTSDTALSVVLPAGVGGARDLVVASGYLGVAARGGVKVGYSPPSLIFASIMGGATSLNQAGGDSVTLTGTNFGSSGSTGGDGTVTQVTFQVGSFISQCTPSQWTATTIRCVAPAGAGSTLLVTLTVDGQATA